MDTVQQVNSKIQNPIYLRPAELKVVHEIDRATKSGASLLTLSTESLSYQHHVVPSNKLVSHLVLVVRPTDLGKKKASEKTHLVSLPTLEKLKIA